LPRRTRSEFLLPVSSWEALIPLFLALLEREVSFILTSIGPAPRKISIASEGVFKALCLNENPEPHSLLYEPIWEKKNGYIYMYD